MTFLWTPRFEKAYRDLTLQHQEAVHASLKLLEHNWRHPSLHIKKLPGLPNVWYIRISRDIRLTFEPKKGIVFLRNVGHHDATLRSP